MGDTVIDPCAGSGSTLRAAYELGRNAYGFEIEKKFYKDAVEKMLVNMQIDMLAENELDTKWEQHLEQLTLNL